MRLAISPLNSLFRLTTPLQKPLIARGDLGYDQQLLPVEVCFNRGKKTSITRKPMAGEAEMDRKRLNRTKPSRESDPSKADRLPESHLPESHLNDINMNIDQQPETLEERLARIKAEIEAGEYDTPEKFEIAIDRMLGSITK